MTIWPQIYDCISKMKVLWRRTTHLADILTYANEGVRKSAGIIAHNGTKLGALGRLLDFFNTSLIVSIEG